MSLLAWFPLNSSTTDLGVANLTMNLVSGSSSVKGAEGKTAYYCYYNGSFTTGSYVSTEKLHFNGVRQSMFAWIKFVTLTSDSSLGGAVLGTHRYPTNTGMGITIKYASSTTGYLSVNTGNGSSRTFNTYCGSTLLQANTWYHVGFTYDGSIIRLYVNGTLDGSHLVTGMSVPDDYLMLGAWALGSSDYSSNSVYGNYKLYGYIQDARVYNHVLSIKEIKNLARGLVVHYDFENVYKEIDYIESTGTQWINTGITPTTTLRGQIILTPNTSYISEYSVLGSAWSASGYFLMFYNSKVRFHSRNYVYDTDTTVAGNKTIIDFYSHSLTSNCVYVDGTSAPNTADYGDTADAASAINLFYVQQDTKMGRFKLYGCKFWDNNTLIRDFVPVIRRSDGVAGLLDKVNNVFYGNSGSGSFTIPANYSTTYIKDCSGNSLHGTVGVTTFSNDSKIGTTAIYLNDQWIQMLNGPHYMPQMSVFMWIKQPTPTTQRFLFGTFDSWTANGIGWWVDSGGTGLSNLVRVAEASGYTGATNFGAVCDGNWHHIGITWDGTNYKTYTDGGLIGTVTPASPGRIYNPVWYFGGGLYNNEKMQGYLADVRVYATALSQADITELYSVREMIDAAGNVYCDATASSDTFTLNKKGIVKAQDYSSGEADYLFVDYIQSSGTQYIKTGITPTLNTGYKADFMITTMTDNPSPMAAQNSSSDGRFGFIVGTSGENRRLWYGKNAWTKAEGTVDKPQEDVPCVVNIKYTVSYNFMNDGLAVQNGIYMMPLSGRTSVAQYELAIFTDCIAGSYTNSSVALTGRIYNFKISESNNLVRDFRPCIRRSDGAVGLYDTITHTFYGNSGSGVFTTSGLTKQDVNIGGKYTRLEYIQSSGTQHIDTGLNIDLNKDSFEVLAQATTPSQNGFILGDWTNGSYYFWLYHYQSGSTIRLYAVNSAGSQTNLVTNLTNANVRPTAYLYKNKRMYVDGTQTANLSSTTFHDYSGTCWLFKASGSSAASYPYQGRIYRAKFWKADKLVRDFIPVQKSNGTLGMYDIVNGVFYANAGSGTFTAGPALGSLNVLGCNNLYKDSGAAVAEYSLTQKDLLGDLIIAMDAGVSSVSCTRIFNDEILVTSSLSSSSTIKCALHKLYTWSSSIKTGYSLVSGGSGSSTFYGTNGISVITSPKNCTVTFSTSHATIWYRLNSPGSTQSDYTSKITGNLIVPYGTVIYYYRVADSGCTLDQTAYSPSSPTSITITNYSSATTLTATATPSASYVTIALTLSGSYATSYYGTVYLRTGSATGAVVWSTTVSAGTSSGTILGSYAATVGTTYYLTGDEFSSGRYIYYISNDSVTASTSTTSVAFQVRRQSALNCPNAACSNSAGMN